jgi:hypothetical protein
VKTLRGGAHDGANTLATLAGIATNARQGATVAPTLRRIGAVVNEFAETGSPRGGASGVKNLHGFSCGLP